MEKSTRTPYTAPNRRVGIEEELLDRVRFRLREVQRAQALHRGDEGRRIAGQAQREVVRLALDVARLATGDGQREQADRHQHETEERQAGGIRESLEAERACAQAKRMVGDPERAQGERCLDEQAAAD